MSGRGSSGSGSTAGGGNKRRNTRRSANKGIVAPGGGTQADVNHLSRHLGLRSDAVHAILNCEGAGVEAVRNRRSGAPPTVSTTTTTTSTAWADFMSEEGFGGGKPHDADTTSNKRPRRGDAHKTDAASSTDKKSSSSSSSSKREYELPIGDKRREKGGILAQTGSLDSSMVGRQKRPLTLEHVDLQCPTILTPSVFLGRKISLVATSSSSCHSICLDDHGRAFAWGRNEHGQCGLGTTSDVVPYPTLISSGGGDTYIGAAAGKSHSILISHNHIAYASGSNKMGQCGINHKSLDSIHHFRKCHIVGNTTSPENTNPTIRPVQASCGENFSMLLTDKGHIYSCGLSEYGQLGNGETGEYFVTASKLAFANATKFERRALFVQSADADNNNMMMTNTEKEKTVPLQDDIVIGSLSCGKNHTIAIEAPSKNNNSHHFPRVFSWGCGDYGCLGHDRQADEYTPRLISTLQGPMFGETNIPIVAAAGGNCSMILTKNGHVYYWGKHRSVGEATMRPTLVDVLANNRHVVTTLSGGFQTVFCSTNNGVTVSWGNGPHGELGYGKDNPKSSAKTKFVEKLDKVMVSDVQCGYGHTLFLLNDNDEEDKKAIEKLPTVETSDLTEFVKVVTHPKSSTTTVTNTTTTTTTSSNTANDNNSINSEEPKKKTKAGRPKKK